MYHTELYKIMQSERKDKIKYLKMYNSINIAQHVLSIKHNMYWIYLLLKSFTSHKKSPLEHRVSTTTPNYVDFLFK